MDWRNWNLPMDAGRGDAIIGTTEDGRPIYRSQLGTQYWQAPRAPKPKPDVASLLPAYGGQYETSKTAPAWAGSQPGLGDLGGVLGGVLGAVMSGVTAPGRALRGQPVTKGDVINTALDWGLLSAPMSAPRGAIRAGGMADDAPKGITAYHGSPHDFDQFDMSKIGTGEGAQAYGHGLYFAEAEDVARGYRDKLAGLSGGMKINGKVYDPVMPKDVDRLVKNEGLPKEVAREVLAYFDETPESMIESATRWPGDRSEAIIKAAEWRKTAKMAPKNGRMYEVNINANPDDFLDWDAPLSEQPNVLSRLGFSNMDEDAIHAEALRIMEAKPGGAWMNDPASKARVDELQNMLDSRAPNLTGQEYYRGASEGDVAYLLSQMGHGDPSGMTKTLRGKGILGIKYLDAGSRGAGTGTRNYVVFDDKLISILRKYGLLPALLGGSGIFNQQQPQG